MKLYSIEAKVKVKSRKVHRTLKDGSEKDYEFKESSINLPRDHEFNDQDEIVIIDKYDFNDYVLGNENQVLELAKKHKIELQSTNEGFAKDKQELENKYKTEISNLKSSYEKQIDLKVKEIKDLKSEHKKTIDDMNHTHDVLENQYKKTKARLDIAFDEQNVLEERIRELENRGVWDYLRRSIKRPALPFGKHD